MIRGNKYRAQKTIVDGVTFASKAEARRYGVLKTLQKVKTISNLRLQVSYTIAVNGQKICRYVADFVYVEKGVEVVEDVKGVKTPAYQLKKKLMKAVLGVEIREVS